MTHEELHDFAVLDLMCALDECDLLPGVPSAATESLSRLRKSALRPDPGSEFVAVYRSTSLISHNRDLKALLVQSDANNARLGISGVLLHYDSTFLQVLEGEEQVVRHLLERIGRDPRHAGMDVIFTHNQYRRVFQDWSMAMINMTTEDFDSILTRLSGYGTSAKKVFSRMHPRASTVGL